MARKERERLRLQDKLRREQLERFRETANTDASKGEVRSRKPRILLVRQGQLREAGEGA